MSRPTVSALVLGVVLAAGSVAVPCFARAADMPIPGPARYQRAGWCPPCGCLHASYVHHRELRSTYGVAFDPRSYDQTEPRYFYGAVRAYPRYWVAGDPLQ